MKSEQTVPVDEDFLEAERLFAVVQACYELTDDNMAREFGGLASAARRFGLKSGVIATCRQADEAIHDGCEISIVPAYDYLSRRGA